ncbi:hypothetical protein J7K25_04935 [bacterium]|nr:hypothetical protein [bacterium]
MFILFLRKNNKFSDFYEKCFSSIGFKSLVVGMDSAEENLFEEIYNLDIFIFEYEDEPEYKEIIKRVREKFKKCKILLLINNFNEGTPSLLKEYSIDLYLTPPFLPSRIIKGLYILLDTGFDLT